MKTKNTLKRFNSIALTMIVTSILVASTTFAQVPTNGVIGSYSFTGNANDLSGNAQNGTIYGATLTTDRFGNANSAYAFDGTSSYISIPQTSFLNTNYSYSYWMKESVALTSSNPYYLFSIGTPGQAGAEGVAGAINSSLGIGGEFYNTNSSTDQIVTVGTSPIVNQWYHVVITRDSSFLKLYVNGTITDSVATNGNIPQYGSNPIFTIGKRFNSTFFFNGVLDDFRIYNCSINASEVKSLFNESAISGTKSLSVSAKPIGTTTSAICNGSVKAIVSGGVPPYIVKFVGNTVSDSVLSLTNLCAGFYTINVIDAKNDSTSITFVISSPATTHTSIRPAYNGSTIIDTLVTTAIPNCSINYSSIDSIIISNYALIGTDSINVAWKIYQASVSNIQYAKYKYSLSGVYKLVLDLYCTNRTLGNSTEGIDEIYIGNRSTGITPIELNNSSIYPNPFSNKLVIIVNKSSSIKITDISGKEIYSTKIDAGKSTIDGGSFDSGIYFIAITDEQTSITKKLIKN